MPSRRDLANAVRALAMDAVEAANSGHPGMPMGMADIAEVLWNDYLRHDPGNPAWPDRDRFVISNGHGSMLQYALLHLSGYDLPMTELRRFRQLHSKTPGHPEAFHTPGVETTTGPLGQGLANAVGMALAEKLLAARYNRPELEIVNHWTWVLVGDGCLMEGISHEVASLAGTLKLGKLVVLYDDNGISIDGQVGGWFSDDTVQRFQAYGWHVVADVDGHDPEAVSRAIAAAQQDEERPSLICCKTTIGFGAPNKAGKESSHGAPLGGDEIVATRQALDWQHDPFEIPATIKSRWDARLAGGMRSKEWQRHFEEYRRIYPALAAEFERRLRGELPPQFHEVAQAHIAGLQRDLPNIASRKASQQAIQALAPELPELIGGSADLAGSNLTLWSGSVDVNVDPAHGNYIYYGVREFGMSAISNGLALHGGFIPYDATFLVFSDYARNAVRMSALIPAGAIHVYTHDSIGLGEDGPTHQPVEHLASLRYIPNNEVWRPCDAVESAVSWQRAIEHRDGPTCLVFSRQNLPCQPRDETGLAAIARGGYILSDPASAKVEAIIIATGSEVELAMAAARELEGEIGVRVVSMPCTSVFDGQPIEYREGVLPDWCRARVAVEAGHPDYWRRYVGLDGHVIGIDSFGASAPAAELFEHFGFTVERLVDAVRDVAGIS
ncbi:MAG: transketolase [Xanthomonadales bacterium]|nr:transketolase [Xanthomonadales bacterium]